MIETKAEICVYKYKVEKNLAILFISLHICFHLHEVENVHQKVSNDLYYFHKVKNIWERNWKLRVNPLLQR